MPKVWSLDGLFLSQSASQLPFTGWKVTRFFSSKHYLLWKGKCQFSLKAHLLTKVDFCTNLPLVQTYHSSPSVPINLHISVSIGKMMPDIYCCRLLRKMADSTEEPSFVHFIPNASAPLVSEFHAFNKSEAGETGQKGENRGVSRE